MELARVSAVRILIVVCCVLALSGCNRGYKPKACEKPREYHSQTSIPALDVPEDLDAPDPANSIQIPDLPSLEDGPAKPGPCLEEPPDYFDTSPV